MRWERCPTCRKFDNLDRHKCAPMWHARLKGEGDDDWNTVHAVDAEEAAENFCEWYDRECDYSIINGGSTVVEVRKVGEDAITVFDITAETIPNYSAREKKP